MVHAGSRGSGIGPKWHVYAHWAQVAQVLVLYDNSRRSHQLPRAVTGLKDAAYENPRHIYQAMLLLAGEYRAMRIATDSDDRKPRQTYEQARDRLHLRDGPSIDEALAGQYGDTYYVYYPVGTEQRQFLDMHLRCGGNTRDPRRCLAIYFFWDDETQQVVVGWLPSHLECGAT